MVRGVSGYTDPGFACDSYLWKRIEEQAKLTTAIQYLGRRPCRSPNSDQSRRSCTRIHASPVEIPWFPSGLHGSLSWFG